MLILVNAIKTLIWPEQPIKSDLIETHELSGGVLFALIERFEADIAGRFGCVREWTGYGV